MSCFRKFIKNRLLITLAMAFVFSVTSFGIDGIAIFGNQYGKSTVALAKTSGSRSSSSGFKSSSFSSSKSSSSSGSSSSSSSSGSSSKSSGGFKSGLFSKSKDSSSTPSSSSKSTYSSRTNYVFIPYYSGGHVYYGHSTVSPIAAVLELIIIIVLITVFIIILRKYLKNRK